MKFLSLSMLVSSAMAIMFTVVPPSFEAGKTYTISWSTTSTGPVTITLRKGNPNNLGTIGPITTSGSGGSFPWTVPSDITPGTDYAFMISQAGETDNYSGQFPIIGGTGTASAGSAAPSGASATSKPVVSGSASAAVSGASAYPSSFSVAPKNSTTTSTGSSSSSASRTSSSTSGSSSATASRVPSTGDAARYGSPVALVLGAFAAMLYFQ